MRRPLDEILPSQVRPAFKQVFSLLQRGKAWEEYRYLDGHYLLSIDGTGQYSSNKRCCGECCERNAAKRLLENIKRKHPHLKLIIIEDALSFNGPHIELIKSLNIRFILGVKPDDNKSLFDWVSQRYTEH